MTHLLLGKSSEDHGDEYSLQLQKLSIHEL